MKTYEQIIQSGDLTDLSADQRTQYYREYCTELDIDWKRMPLAYIQVDDEVSGRKTILYALRNCADQLRVKRGVSIVGLVREEREGYVVYKAEAKMPDGRTDSAIGAVSTHGKTGQAKANADMHADTKARRRVTLDICGVGLLDETEIADMNSKTQVVVTPGLIPQAEEILPAPAAVAGHEASPAQVEAQRALALSLPKIVANIDKSPNADINEKSSIAYINEKSSIAYTPYGNIIAIPTAAPIESSRTVTCADMAVRLEVFGPMPTPVELADFRKRMAKYTNEILPEGGLVASAGLSLNAKVKKFFIAATGAKDGNSLTKEQWESTLTFLDQYVLKEGPRGLVKHVEEKIA